MKKSGSRIHYGKLFVLGAGLNLMYLCVLLTFDTSRHNLSPRSTEMKESVWVASDAGTYIRAARSFLNQGAFLGSHGLPDDHRTIGYPAFLALMMTLGGKQWLWLTLITQACLFAVVYPVLAYLAKTWFSLSLRSIHLLLLVYVLVGAGVVYTPIFLTDQAFTVTFWSVLCLGTLALKKGGAGYWTGHFLLLLFAANIRPTLALFPFAFLALVWALRIDWRSRVPQLGLVFMLQFALCQTPAARNYIHHGVWIPCDVMVNNLSDYLAKDVLRYGGELDVYEEALPGWEDQSLEERVERQSEFAKGIFLEHPVRTLGIAAVNFTVNTIETHWIQTFHYFRTSLHSDLKRFAVIPVPLLMFHLGWAVLHAAIALTALSGLWLYLRRKEWAWLVFVGIYMLPYAFSATDIQGARFRLYCEGLILMFAFKFLQEKWILREKI